MRPNVGIRVGLTISIRVGIGVGLRTEITNENVDGPSLLSMAMSPSPGLMYRLP